jgi:hypothetical protein
LMPMSTDTRPRTIWRERLNSRKESTGYKAPSRRGSWAREVTKLVQSRVPERAGAAVSCADERPLTWI